MDIGKIEQAVRTVRDQAGFIKLLLAEGLDWPVQRGVTKVEDIAYGWSKDDLQVEEMDKHFVDGQVWQIQPLDPGRTQPWGIFILEFARPDVFTKGRGMTGPLRRILRRLVPKRRQQPSHAVWDRKNLLFICTHKYEHFSVAYFKEPPEGSNTAPLAIFGWGPDIPSRTAIEFNLPALDWPDEGVPPENWVAQWAGAFDVEKVTRKFYEEYAAVFTEVEAQMPTSLAKAEDRRLYTQLLMNRLMFLRFIERKGWLKLGRSPNYLQELFASTPPKASFYKTRLRRLFFEGLALEEHTAADVIGNVPFLNGGLFEEGPLDKKVEDIPNAAFEFVLGKTEGIFYHYNFTVEESTPLDIQVAVDPEMLGKVFEELVTGRHESGSYYTPRPVVAFMCREALKGHLAAKTQASPEAIAMLVDNHHAGALSETHARAIVQALDNVKAVDPACGSGAYLLGLLQEMVALYRLLYSEKLTKDSRSLYELKLRIISNNLYGVDIDPFATNIAMLRLWLSIAVDSDQPLPLPNLDFKIETGDALTGRFNVGGQMFQEEIGTKSIEIARLEDEYMRASNNDDKEKRKKELNKEIEYLRKMLHPDDDEDGKAIIWNADFAQAFAPRRATSTTMGGELGFMADITTQKAFKITTFDPGGFDIVLANPPYIRQELIIDLKPRLQDVFGDDMYCGTADLYTYFYARAVQILAPDGVLVFISSNKFFRANYGKKLRKFLAEKTHVLSITDFGELPVFQASATFPMIFIAKKTKQPGATIFTQVESLKAPYPDVLGVIHKNGQCLPSEAIKGHLWTLTDAASAECISKMEHAGVPLVQYVKGRIFRGLVTGLNAAFYISDEMRAQLIANDKRSAEIIKPLAVGDNVRRWHIRDDRWVIVTRVGIDIKKYPAVLAYLKTFQDRLEVRWDKGDFWYELRSCAYYDEFEKPKIVYPDIGKEPRFALDTNGHYLDATATCIGVDDLYLLGLLNSQTVWEYVCEKCAVLGDAQKGGRVRLKTFYVEQIPIPNPSDSKKRAISDLVQKCLDAGGENCERWEAEINQRVAALYGV